MNGYIVDLEKITSENEHFRQVLYTASHSQLVAMALDPGQDIGQETHHHLDQFIRIESGTGTAVLNDTQHHISDGWAIIIPAGVRHNIINSGKTVMKLYTVYSPPEHRDGTIRHTKTEAEENTEHFDGKTTE